MKDMKVKRLIEMAKPTEAHMSSVWYHGVPFEDRAKWTMEHGITPRNMASKSRKAMLAPVEGMVYITRSLRYAAIYAVGGDMFGGVLPKAWLKNDPYGYLFVVNGSQLRDVQPDEDGVGELLSIMIRDEERGGGSRNDQYQNNLDDVAWLYEFAEERLTRGEWKKVGDGEYTYWAVAGKKLIPNMTDEQKVSLINAGCHVAHGGILVPDQVWRINKRKNVYLKTDASNFFDVAERIK